MFDRDMSTVPTALYGLLSGDARWYWVDPKLNLILNGLVGYLGTNLVVVVVVEVVVVVGVVVVTNSVVVISMVRSTIFVVVVLENLVSVVLVLVVVVFTLVLVAFSVLWFGSQRHLQALERDSRG